MASWLLRIPGGEISIEQTCVIGRSSDCEAAIDDPNASRRNTFLRVVGSDVVVEDLQSRNGTFVDGRLIGSPTTISTRARIIIGHTVMTLEPAPPRPTRRSVRPGAMLQAPDAVQTNTDVPDRAMLDRARAMLAAGRNDEAAGGASIVMRRQSAMGPRAEDEFVRGVSEVLVALAMRTGDARWLEGLFGVNTDCDRVIPAELVDVIETLVTPGAVRLLPAYVEKMSARAATLSPADRMVIARIERLAR